MRLLGMFKYASLPASKKRFPACLLAGFTYGWFLGGFLLVAGSWAGSQSVGGLKMTDMENQNVQQRVPASAHQLSPAEKQKFMKQQAEVLKQLEQYKQQRQEGFEYLEELEKNGEI